MLVPHCGDSKAYPPPVQCCVPYAPLCLLRHRVLPLQECMHVCMYACMHVACMHVCGHVCMWFVWYVCHVYGMCGMCGMHGMHGMHGMYVPPGHWHVSPQKKVHACQTPCGIAIYLCMHMFGEMVTCHCLGGKCQCSLKGASVW